MTRAAVHAASGNPLGAAAPRREGPADLRLVPPALAAWAAAALATGAPGGWIAGVVLAGLALAGVALVRAALPPGPGARGVRRRVNGVAVAAVLLCAVAGRAPPGCTARTGTGARCPDWRTGTHASPWT